jgi:signal transduction histidine kinase
VSAEVPVSERSLPSTSEGRSANGISLRRLGRRFFAAEADDATLDRATMARAFMLLYGAGATLVLATIPLASSDGRFLPGIVAPPIIAYGVVALLAIKRGSLPLWFFRALPPFGAVLVTMLAYSAGTASFHVYALIYFWVIVSAFYFFRWIEAVPGCVIAGIGYAAALLHHQDAQDRLLYWIMGVGTLVVTSTLLAQLRERLKHLVRALRESDMIKTTIIRSVSHDFRTPLTAIIAAGESSASTSLDPETRRELSAMIVSEASRLSETLAKLLDLSRLEAGATRPYRTWCSVEEVVEVALERTSAREVFDLVVPESPPPVWADAAQLERAFSNILDNSSRYAGSDLVRVRLERNGRRLCVRIADKGPGLAPGDEKLIFEPFYHGRDETSGHHGPGLGLAIARGFIEINGGQIRVESEPGKGTTFLIDFPLTDIGGTNDSPNGR